MFKYIKKEYSFTDPNIVREKIRGMVDNIGNEDTTGVLNSNNTFWIRDKYVFTFKSIFSLPTRIYGNIKLNDNKAIVSIRVVPDFIYFYFQIFGLIFIIDQIIAVKWSGILGGLAFIVAVTIVAYLDAKMIYKKFERVLNN